jgi:hypothetical protein
MLGLNSGAMLKAQTAKYTIFDEVDAYPASASGSQTEGEGDPILLTERASLSYPDAFQSRHRHQRLRHYQSETYGVRNRAPCSQGAAQAGNLQPDGTASNNPESLAE